MGCSNGTTEPPGPAALEELTGSSGQEAFVGTAVAQAPGVVLRDAAGNPMQGVQVTFAVTARGASVVPEVVSTDAGGRARVSAWILGELPGENRLTATAGGLTTTISASGRAGPATEAEKIGDRQMGEVNTQLTNPPGVRVLDRFKNPVPNVPVVFSVLAGAGRIDSAQTRTDVNGLATPGRWTLGARVGENIVQAIVNGLLFVELTATARAGPPAVLITSGDNQSALVGPTVPGPIVVTVADAAGNPLPNVTVAFTVSKGGGSITGDRNNSDALGSVRLGSWRLGTTAGVNALEVVAQGVSSTITAQGTADVPAAIAIVSGDQQTDTTDAILTQRPTVRVSDRYGNVVAGVPVAFGVAAGGGRVSAATATDVRGEATVVWTLGSSAGLNTLNATVSGVMQFVQFAATAEWPTFAATTVAMGGAHTCALDRTMSAFCWGSNNRGQLGDGKQEDRAYPRPVVTNQTFQSLTSGATHTCALTALGDAYCWGSNSFGQLGDGSGQDRSAPAPVTGGLKFASVTAGANHTCGLTQGGEAFCWGLGSSGQLGNGILASSTPALVSSRLRFRALSAGGHHTCGIVDDGTTQCWGLGVVGQLGDGDTQIRAFPVLVRGGLTFAALGAGGVHTCALDNGRELYCWGENAAGEIGDGTIATRLTPRRSIAIIRYASVTLGWDTTCGIAVDSLPYCWGNDAQCQLGRGVCSNEPHPLPVRVSLPLPSPQAHGIYAGDFAVCATAATTLHLYCWGSNAYGELGDGTTAIRSRPTRVRAR